MLTRKTFGCSCSPKKCQTSSYPCPGGVGGKSNGLMMRRRVEGRMGPWVAQGHARLFIMLHLQMATTTGRDACELLGLSLSITHHATTIERNPHGVTLCWRSAPAFPKVVGYSMNTRLPRICDTVYSTKIFNVSECFSSPTAHDCMFLYPPNPISDDFECTFCHILI